MTAPLVPLRRVLTSSAPVIDSAAYGDRYSVARVQAGGVLRTTARRGRDMNGKRLHMVQAGQFVIARQQTHQRRWCLAPPDWQAALISGVYRVFNLHPDVLPAYFAAYIAAPAFRGAVLAARSKQGLLDTRKFLSIRFPLPPLETQTRVADVWLRLCELQRHTDDMSASVSALKREVTGTLFRQRQVEQVLLGACADIGQEAHTRYVVTITRMGEVLLEAGQVQDGEIGIIPRPELDFQYLYYALENQRGRLRLAQREPDPVNALRTVAIPLPTLYEQRKRAIILLQHDEALHRLRVESAALRKLAHSLMHLIFTGQLTAEDANEALALFD